MQAELEQERVTPINVVMRHPPMEKRLTDIPMSRPATIQGSEQVATHNYPF